MSFFGDLAKGALFATPILGKAVYGFYQNHEAEKGLKELNKTPYPTYLTGQQVNEQANAMNPTGYTAAERANFFGALARKNNAQYRLAKDSNPSLSGAIQAGINFGNTGALLNFSGQDAAIRRNNLSRLESLIRGQANLNTGSQIQRRQQQEQAYGQAAQAGIQNIATAGDELLNVGMAFATGGFGGIGGKSGGVTAGVPAGVTAPAPIAGSYIAPSMESFMQTNVSPYTTPYVDETNFPYNNQFRPY